MDTAESIGGDADQGRAPAGEDVREYARRLRSLPVEQLLRDVLFSLLNAAQIKLGRRDARLLIDVAAVAHEQARPYLSGELTRQIDEALGQLRLGQVTAEGQANRRAEREDNDLDRVPTPPSTGAAQARSATAAASAADRPSSRLWIPGR